MLQYKDASTVYTVSLNRYQVLYRTIGMKIARGKDSKKNKREETRPPAARHTESERHAAAQPTGPPERGLRLLTTLVSAGEKGMAFFKQFTKLAHQNVLTGTEAEADWTARCSALLPKDRRDATRDACACVLGLAHVLVQSAKAVCDSARTTLCCPQRRWACRGHRPPTSAIIFLHASTTGAPRRRTRSFLYGRIFLSRRMSWIAPGGSPTSSFSFSSSVFRSIPACGSSHTRRPLHLYPTIFHFSASIPRYSDLN